jgi:hypothetical protein
MMTELEDKSKIKKLLHDGLKERSKNKLTRGEKDEINLNLTIMK